MTDKGLYRGTDETTRRLLDWAVSKGWDYERTQGGHIRLTHPRCATCFHSSTTSDKYSWLACRARLRQNMLAAGYTKEEVR